MKKSWLRKWYAFNFCKINNTVFHLSFNLIINRFHFWQLMSISVDKFTPNFNSINSTE
jgi:hypothetical protein